MCCTSFVTPSDVYGIQNIRSRTASAEVGDVVDASSGVRSGCCGSFRMNADPFLRQGGGHHIFYCMCLILMNTTYYY